MKYAFVLSVFLRIAWGQIQSNTARHIVWGASLPAHCTPNTGDVFFKTTATIGPYFCSATDTWTPMSGGGGGCPSGSDGQFQYKSGSNCGGMSGSIWTDATRLAQFQDASNNDIIVWTANILGNSNGNLFEVNYNNIAPSSVGTASGSTGPDVPILAVKGGNTSIATTGFGGSGGSIFLNSGPGGIAPNAVDSSTGGGGGQLDFRSGTGGDGRTGSDVSRGGSGGNATIRAASGGSSNGVTTSVAGLGGILNLSSGDGGSASGAGDDTARNGGAVNITAGAGGTASGGMTNAAGNGGSIVLTPGTAGSGDTPGLLGKVKVNGAFPFQNGTCTAATLAAILTGNGDQCYCTDCKVTTVAANVVSDATCTGSGSGTLAIQVAGTAKCLYLP